MPLDRNFRTIEDKHVLLFSVGFFVNLIVKYMHF